MPNHARGVALGAALWISDQGTRRAALRKLATPDIKSWDSRGLADLCANSPIIAGHAGSMAGAINVLPTPSSFRDAFSENVLVGVISGALDAADVHNAINSPHLDSFKSTRTSHGFEFGRPSWLDASARARIDDTVTKFAHDLVVAEGWQRLIDLCIAEGLTAHQTMAAVRGLNDAWPKLWPAVAIPPVPFTVTTPSTSGASASGSTTAASASSTKGTTTMTNTPTATLMLDLRSLVAVFDVLVTSHGADIGQAKDVIADIMTFALAQGAVDHGNTEALTNAALAVISSRQSTGAPMAPEAMPSEFQPLVDTIVREWNTKTPTNVEEQLGGAANVELPEIPQLDVDPAIAAVINTVLTANKLPSLDALSGMLKGAREVAEQAVKEVANLRSSVARAAMAPTIPSTVAGSGEVPNGKVVMRKAADVFDVKKGAAAFQFEVPTFDWDAPHPHVPAVDPDYMFRPDSLITALVALVKGDRPWIHGHTGTGKSTLIEQIAARLSWPVMRVNFDSEITRMDLVGRDTLKTDPATGQTITEWVDGILPTALKGPYILLLDEIDFVRPDVSYVLQRALEGKGLLLTEKGGELIVPHAMNRIVATANTVGQGDEFGLYQGARPQSMAFLDRFGPFIAVPYLPKEAEKALIKKRNPTLDNAAADIIVRYVHEHRQAFTNAEVMQPISPRGVNALASNYVMYLSILGDAAKAMRKAFDDTIISRASQTDAAILKGLVDRVLK